MLALAASASHINRALATSIQGIRIGACGE